MQSTGPDLLGCQLSFVYFTPFEFGLHPHRQLNSRLFYTWWQWRVRAVISQICREQRIDLLHHLTWGTYRFPTFLGGLGPPVVLGPLGGGDTAPARLYRGLPLREQFREAVRTASLHLTRFDPLVGSGLNGAKLILCKTEETRNGIGERYRSKTALAAEIAAPEIPASVLKRLVDPVNVCERQHSDSRRFRLLYAGRLIGMKGLLPLFGAMRSLVRQGRPVELWLAGDGPLRGLLEARGKRWGISDHLRFLGMLPREELMRLYEEADLFVFPSLHDSSGNVVLESLSRGLPVVCLDLGGPKHYVNQDCAVVVTTGNSALQEVELKLASEVAKIMDAPRRLEAMKVAAVRHARGQTWANCVEAAYRLIEPRLGWATAVEPPASAGAARTA